MKKTKRILALIGAILLFFMYASTLVFALIGSKDAIQWLKVSIACTIIVPVMLYGYILVYRLIAGTGGSQDNGPDEKNTERKDSHR